MKVAISKSKLDSLAVKIAAKSGETLPLTLDEMGDEVDALTKPSGTKQITQNDTGIDVTEYAAVDVNVPTGGGTVIGTFKGTTTGTAMDINIPYTGNGYPIALLITPTEGPANSNTGTFYNTLKRYACAIFFATKDAADAAPSYSGAAADAYTGFNRYKSSATTATTQNNSSIISHSVCYDTDATGGVSNIVRIRAKNIISVYIAGTSYGFMANIEYTYHIIYSE